MLLAAVSPSPPPPGASTSAAGTTLSDGTSSSGAHKECGELLWSQICSCLNAPERDEVKRILGIALIERNEDLHNELSALKTILDDYRVELEARPKRDGSDPVDKHNSSRSRVAEQSMEKNTSSRGRRNKHEVVPGTASNKLGSTRKFEHLPAPPQRRFLENQIRMFVSGISSLGSKGTATNLSDGASASNLNSDSLNGLRTPRERDLINMIVNSDRCALKSNGLDDDEETRRIVTQLEPRRVRKNYVGGDVGKARPSRPGTAPGSPSSGDRVMPSSIVAGRPHDSRPASRDSNLSTISAPDILQGFTPYLNVFDVEKVVKQLQDALEEESNTLLSQIRSVQKTLESMYIWSSQQNIAKNNIAQVNSSSSKPAEPTIAELKELSGWLEQRYRLEDIFRKASQVSRKPRNKIVPLLRDDALRRNGSIAGGVRHQHLSRATFEHTKLKSTSSAMPSAENGWSDSGKTLPFVQKKSRKNRNTLRSRIREAQDAQYLM